ncbi:hypothetical protein B0J12DRAFT_660357 [Macrophomina phaseolina]|uniref:Secreted protein n=1 Tax=Macrophomina phaseolina TaxID=35725 RepID=A0ABQ8GD59_9PEZI|nr:hypothetical protein B0J12DRAFT_660357 [Macrophomina phaseolina]
MTCGPLWLLCFWGCASMTSQPSAVRHHNNIPLHPFHGGRRLPIDDQQSQIWIPAAAKTRAIGPKHCCAYVPHCASVVCGMINCWFNGTTSQKENGTGFHPFSTLLGKIKPVLPSL